jgi:hypothetical protein
VVSRAWLILASSCHLLAANLDNHFDVNNDEHGPRVSRCSEPREAGAI